MSKQKLTPWFRADVKPVRVGFYERQWNVAGWSREQCLGYWDGWCWRYVGKNREIEDVAYSNRRWRGLAYDPSKGEKKC